MCVDRMRKQTVKTYSRRAPVRWTHQDTQDLDIENNADKASSIEQSSLDQSKAIAATLPPSHTTPPPIESPPAAVTTTKTDTSTLKAFKKPPTETRTGSTLSKTPLKTTASEQNQKGEFKLPSHRYTPILETSYLNSSSLNSHAVRNLLSLKKNN